MVGPHASAREFAAQHRVWVGHLVAREVWVERWPKARVGSGGSRAPGPLVLALCPVRSPPLPRSFIIFISAKGLPDEELLKTSRLDCSKLEDGAGGGGPGAALVRVRARALPPGHPEGPSVPRGAAAPRAPPRPAGGTRRFAAPHLVLHASQGGGGRTSPGGPPCSREEEEEEAEGRGKAPPHHPPHPLLLPGPAGCPAPQLPLPPSSSHRRRERATRAALALHRPQSRADAGGRAAGRSMTLPRTRSTSTAPASPWAGRRSSAGSPRRRAWGAARPRSCRGCAGPGRSPTTGSPRTRTTC